MQQSNKQYSINKFWLKKKSVPSLIKWLKGKVTVNLYLLWTKIFTIPQETNDDKNDTLKYQWSKIW